MVTFALPWSAELCLLLRWRKRSVIQMQLRRFLIRFRRLLAMAQF